MEVVLFELLILTILGLLFLYLKKKEEERNVQIEEKVEIYLHENKKE